MPKATQTPRRKSSQSTNASAPRPSRRKDAAAPPAELDDDRELASEVEQSIKRIAADIRSRRLKSWNDAKLREQTRGLILANMEAQDASRIRRGKLRPLEWIRERDAKRAELVKAKLRILIDAAVALVPAEQQPAARFKMDQAAAQFQTEMADAIRQPLK